jgi:photosystem II stability/assembly factor-like uncharacterized protein
MADKLTLLVGTVGQGVMRSGDDGESWQRIGVKDGLHSDAIIRSLLGHPRQSEKVYAGTDKGLFLSEDAGQRWERMDSPMNDHMLWCLSMDPSDPQTMFAGTGTPTVCKVFRTTDGAKTWDQLPVQIAEECANVGIPRVTGIAVDPVNQNNIWLGLEVDGVRFSSDRGESWKTINGAITNPDVHAVAVAAGPPKTVLVAVNDEVYTSTDDGDSWTSLKIREVFPWKYPRGMLVKPDDSKVVFLTIGDATPGRTGTVMRSEDAGHTWKSLSLPVQPNTAMWVVNIQPSDTSVVMAGSRYGYLYRSDDAGESWRKLWREFSEISSVVSIPA